MDENIRRQILRLQFVTLTTEAKGKWMCASAHLKAYNYFHTYEEILFIKVNVMPKGCNKKS